MKKLANVFALLAALGLALGFVGCSNGSDNSAALLALLGGDSGGSGGGGGGGGSGGETGGKTAATISFAESDVGKGAEDAAFTNELSNTGDGAVTYSSSNTGVATVDAVTGQVAIVAEGTTTITATVADSETYSYAQKKVSYTLTVYPAAAAVPLTIEIKSGESSGVLTVKNPWTTFKYKFSNSDEFHSYTGPINITSGVSVSFYADGSENTSSENSCLNIRSDVDCYVYGNVNSLNDSQNFFKNINKDYAFACLFKEVDNDEHIYNHPTKDLYLPSRVATEECYKGMFLSCVNLERAPALPATKLASCCYYSMFSGCRKLARAPELPATKLAYGCYHAMFNKCNELTSTPALNAAKLEPSCYNQMFQDCSKLEHVYCFATDISALMCTWNWLRQVKSTGEFVRKYGMNDWPKNSASGIPSGWEEWTD